MFTFQILQQPGDTAGCHLVKVNRWDILLCQNMVATGEDLPFFSVWGRIKVLHVQSAIMNQKHCLICVRIRNMLHGFCNLVHKSWCKRVQHLPSHTSVLVTKNDKSRFLGKDKRTVLRIHHCLQLLNWIHEPNQEDWFGFVGSVLIASVSSNEMM